MRHDGGNGASLEHKVKDLPWPHQATYFDCLVPALDVILQAKVFSNSILVAQRMVILDLLPPINPAHMSSWCPPCVTFTTANHSSNQRTLDFEMAPHHLADQACLESRWELHTHMSRHDGHKSKHSVVQLMKFHQLHQLVFQESGTVHLSIVNVLQGCIASRLVAFVKQPVPEVTIDAPLPGAHIEVGLAHLHKRACVHVHVHIGAHHACTGVRDHAPEVSCRKITC